MLVSLLRTKQEKVYLILRKINKVALLKSEVHSDEQRKVNRTYSRKKLIYTSESHFTTRLGLSSVLPDLTEGSAGVFPLSRDIPGACSRDDWTAGNSANRGFSSDMDSILRRLLSGGSMTIRPSDVQHCLIPKCLRAAVKTSCRDLVRNSETVIAVPFSEVYAFQTRLRSL